MGHYYERLLSLSYILACKRAFISINQSLYNGVQIQKCTVYGEVYYRTKKNDDR